MVADRHQRTARRHRRHVERYAVRRYAQRVRRLVVREHRVATIIEPVIRLRTFERVRVRRRVRAVLRQRSNRVQVAAAQCQFTLAERQAVSLRHIVVRQAQRRARLQIILIERVCAVYYDVAAAYCYRFVDCRFRRQSRIESYRRRAARQAERIIFLIEREDRIAAVESCRRRAHTRVRICCQFHRVVHVAQRHVILVEHQAVALRVARAGCYAYHIALHKRARVECARAYRHHVVAAASGYAQDVAIDPGVYRA